MAAATGGRGAECLLSSMPYFDCGFCVGFWPPATWEKDATRSEHPGAEDMVGPDGAQYCLGGLGFRGQGFRGYGFRGLGFRGLGV